MKERTENEIPNFKISEYENWTAVLNRIKQDEQRWFSTLLILYGAVLTFLLSKSADELVFINYCDKIIGLISSFIVINLITFMWAYQSLNLRLQYYRAMAEIVKIQKYFKEKINDAWDSKTFEVWYEEITRPKESKNAEFWFLGGLYLTSMSLAVYRFYYQYHFEFNNCLVTILSLVGFIGLFYFPLYYYRFYDKKNMRKLHSKLAREN